MAEIRSRGEGSWSRREDRDCWRFRVSLPEGRKTFLGKTKNDCLAKYHDYLERRNILGIRKRTRATVRDYVLAYAKEPSLEPTTATTVLAFIRIIDNCPGNFLDRGITEITPAVAEDFLFGLTEKSYNTVSRIRLILCSAFTIAIRERIITNNPFVGIKLPKRSFSPTRSRTILSITEIAAATEYIRERNHPVDWMLLFILHTGLRAGELLGLQWSDVREDSIVIRHNRVRVDKEIQKEGFVLKGPKSQKGRREIPLSSTAKEILDYFRHMERRRDDYVFVNTDGSTPSAQLLRYHVKQMCLAKDLPRISTHELRHSFGSMLIAKGVDIGVVSALMGHSDVSVTYNFYIHFSDSQLRSAVSVLG
jgi:integrase